jgi:hypothetical protein
MKLIVACKHHKAWEAKVVGTLETGDEPALEAFARDPQSASRQPAVRRLTKTSSATCADRATSLPTRSRLARPVSEHAERRRQLARLHLSQFVEDQRGICRAGRRAFQAGVRRAP